MQVQMGLGLQPYTTYEVHAQEVHGHLTFSRATHFWSSRTKEERRTKQVTHIAEREKPFVDKHDQKKKY